MSKNYWADRKLVVRFDDGEWVIHDPATTDDTILIDESTGQSYRRDEFNRVQEHCRVNFPGADVRG